MASHNAVSGGEEPAKSPIKGVESVLGANSSVQTRRLRTNDLGQPEVVVVQDLSSAGAGIQILAVGTLTGLTSAMGQQTLKTYTITTERALSSITVSGTIYAKVEVLKNLTRIETLRMGPIRNVTFDTFAVTSGDIIDIKVSHTRVAPTTGDYECTIRGI